MPTFPPSLRFAALAARDLLDDQAQRQAGPDRPVPSAVPKSPFIKARSSARVRSGADGLCIGCYLGPGAVRKPAYLLRFTQGCIPTPFYRKATPFTADR
jgi:hypothetical protein